MKEEKEEPGEIVFKKASGKMNLRPWWTCRQSVTTEEITDEGFLDFCVDEGYVDAEGQMGFSFLTTPSGSPLHRAGLLSSLLFVILSSRRISYNNARYWQEMLRSAQQDSKIINYDRVVYRSDESDKRTREGRT